MQKSINTRTSHCSCGFGYSLWKSRSLQKSINTRYRFSVSFCLRVGGKAEACKRALTHKKSSYHNPFCGGWKSRSLQKSINTQKVLSLLTRFQNRGKAEACKRALTLNSFLRIVNRVILVEKQKLVKEH